MCGHASSGKEISERILSELYPLIDGHIRSVECYLEQSAVCSEAGLLFDLFYRVKSGFEAVKDHTTQLVFPAVLSVFGTKNKAGMPFAVPVAVLQQEAVAKEAVLMQLISDMEQEAEWLQLPESHPVACLLTAFTTEFASCKKEWQRMLQHWNSTCACFAAAHAPLVPETTTSFENH
ncbi:MAG: hypothetical protein JNL13_12725 [Chitinophagaceae bacterium]|nr:hypothetical protein [Chitinophagaceae bacterium]